MAAPAKSTPRDAQIVAAILKDMGIQEHEPRVINQLLEFVYRYTTDILEESKVYCAHAGRKNLEVDDIKLAAQCRMDHSFTSPPPRDLVMEIARHKNSQPLPLIKPSAGLRLPPDRYCLALPNYKIKSSKKQRILNLTSSQLPGSRISFASLQGAGGGRVSGGTLTVVTKASSQPTVTIINKAVTLASSSGAKPTIRVTPATATTTQVPKPIIRVGSSGGSMTSIVPTVVTPHSTVVLSTSAPAQVTLPSITTPITASAAVTAFSLQQGIKRKAEDDDYDK